MWKKTEKQKEGQPRQQEQAVAIRLVWIFFY